MGFAETIVFYLLIGCTVGTAVFVTHRRRGFWQAAIGLGIASLFWPLYLPVLLSARGQYRTSPETSSEPERDEMAVAIAQVERELDGALSSLDGWAEDALSAEACRIAELRSALAAQAARIREMDELLAEIRSCETEVNDTDEAARPLTEGAHQRWQRSQQARAQNLDRLGQVRCQAHADLMATLAWIRELVSMIHLAKFTGAPASRASALVAQIAAAVEGVSAVAWSDPDYSPPRESASSAAPVAPPRTAPEAKPRTVEDTFHSSGELTGGGLMSVDTIRVDGLGIDAPSTIT